MVIEMMEDGKYLTCKKTQQPMGNRLKVIIK
jgi:hypothetical protein